MAQASSTADAERLVELLNGEAKLRAALTALLAKHDDRDGLSDLWPQEAAAAREALGLPAAKPKARTLPPFPVIAGMRVRMLEPTSGQDHESIEHELPVGAIGIIAECRACEHGGFAVDIVIPVDWTIDPKDGAYMCSIVNTYDGADEPAWPFEPVSLDGETLKDDGVSRVIAVYGDRREATEAAQKLQVQRRSGEGFAIRRTKDGRAELTHVGGVGLR